MRYRSAKAWYQFGILIVVLWWVGGCSNTNQDEGKIVLGQALGITIAPIFVANRKGYWEQQELDVQLRPFVAGRLAVDGLLSGHLDIATVGDTPLAYAFFKHKNLRVIATIMESNRGIKVVASRDAGIVTAGDLKGKRIGVFIGTTGEFFAVRFLEAAGLAPSDVSLVNIKPQDMVAALSKGSIDAFVSWEPHVYNAKQTLGDRVQVLQNSGIYVETMNLVTTEELFRSKPEAMRRVLKTVIRAVNYLSSHREESIQITAKELGMDPEGVKAIWRDYDFSVTLNEALLSSLQQQGKWIMNSGSGAGLDELPDYRSIFIVHPLKVIDPSAVSID